MERKFSFCENEYYHVYSRGVDKRQIFLDNNDRERFMRSLFLSNSGKPFVTRDVAGTSLKNISRDNPRTAIGSFCLMPNHIHLLLKETEDGGISSFMSKLLTGYSMYFNKKYKRTGALFDGAFRARHVDKDGYLQLLFSYIHLNPVKLIEPEWKEKGIQNQKIVEEYLKKYRYSSFEDYLAETGNEREEALILDKEAFEQCFDDAKDFKGFIDDSLAYYNEEDLDLKLNKNKKQDQDKESELEQ